MGWGDKMEEGSSTFVWSKKLEKEGLKNLSRKEVEHLNKIKKQENLEELEKLKKRRHERELIRQERENEMYQQQRSKEAAQFDEWQRQEENFHLEQARLRSKIRIQDGRAKPIDLLAQYISDQNLEESIEMQMHEPYEFIRGLSIDDLEDLLADIKVYNELEKSSNSDYWDDIMIIVDDDLKKLKKVESETSYQGRREGIHQSVAQDVSKIFRGKTTTQLNELRTKIEDKLSSKSDGIDIGYWESLLSQLKAHMARARLRDRHQENLKRKLELLKKEQEEILIKKEEEDQDEDMSEVKAPSSNSNSPRPSTSKECLPSTSKAMDTDESSQDSQDYKANETDLLQECFKLYEKGNYSPKYIKPADIESYVEVITEEDNQRHLEELRSKLIEDEDEDAFSQQEMQLRKEARKGMNDDEAEFSVEAKLDPQTHLWSSEKYRPRKPRYFNRVHTGFEWNKYNQTHYDIDNPPPKIVQGYKFNIFYPDLINKSITPQYFLTPCADNADFAILKFHSGPPYEDIAFKIVNREWEYSYKRGFRCQFQNNIFQLWFHFKRYRYRR